MRNDIGDFLGLSGHVSLTLNDAKLDDLFDFKVSRTLLGVLPLESRDSRRK